MPLKSVQMGDKSEASASVRDIHVTSKLGCLRSGPHLSSLSQYITSFEPNDFQYDHLTPSSLQTLYISSSFKRRVSSVVPRHSSFLSFHFTPPSSVMSSAPRLVSSAATRRVLLQCMYFRLFWTLRMVLTPSSPLPPATLFSFSRLFAAIQICPRTATEATGIGDSSA